MPEPIPTTRDRELAEAFVAAAIFAEFQAYQVNPDDMVAALAEFRARARQEGREEGLREVHPVLGVLFVLTKDGCVLMERCPDKAQILPGEWFIPGGRIEAGETPIGALNRELGEELGIVPLRTVEGPLVDAGANLPIPFLMRLFVVVEWAGEVPEECIDAPGTLLRWIPTEEAKREARGAIQAILDHAVELVNHIPEPVPSGAKE